MSKKKSVEESLTNLQGAVLNILNAARLLGLPHMTEKQIKHVITLIQLFKENPELFATPIKELERK